MEKAKATTSTGVMRGFAPSARVAISPGASEHLDAALLHLQDEVVVILLRFMYPQHVVEEQFRAIAGRQPLMGQPRAADHDAAQRADFAMNTEPLHDVSSKRRACAALSSCRPGTPFRARSSSCGRTPAPPRPEGWQSRGRSSP